MAEETHPNISENNHLMKTLSADSSSTNDSAEAREHFAVLNKHGIQMNVELLFM